MNPSLPGVGAAASIELVTPASKPPILFFARVRLHHIAVHTFRICNTGLLPSAYVVTCLKAPFRLNSEVRVVDNKEDEERREKEKEKDKAKSAGSVSMKAILQGLASIKQEQKLIEKKGDGKCVWYEFMCMYCILSYVLLLHV